MSTPMAALRGIDIGHVELARTHAAKPNSVLQNRGFRKRKLKRPGPGNSLTAVDDAWDGARAPKEVRTSRRNRPPLCDLVDPAMRLHRLATAEE
ncbi:MULTISPECIES: hypothetical protein [Paracoccus]|uniref:hypothetical protein n=1 Tax=Paracoccus TaxID=265 RepID=UPI0011150B49|nr:MULTISPECIES: hypothetical protein [Paracoccus]MCJ1900545.1 hypothetical protein [Paracoccus versutus]MDF3905552.1 hypothetical protein [Paracoccus sp. AS002]WGR56973.1 hypothetical protein E3U25_13080 [Paracoccus versutus]